MSMRFSLQTSDRGRLWIDKEFGDFEVRCDWGQKHGRGHIMNNMDLSPCLLPWGEAFLRGGPERRGTWVYGDCYPAHGLIETASQFPGAPREFSFFLPEDYWN